MFKIFEIRGKRFEYSNNIRAQKLLNMNPNIQDSGEKIRIQIRIRIIRSSLNQVVMVPVTQTQNVLLRGKYCCNTILFFTIFQVQFYIIPVEDEYNILADRNHNYVQKLDTC